MKLEWHPVLDTGGCGISATPHEYDGHPAVDWLRLDYSPRFASPVRLAAAAVLAFRPFISGALILPLPVSPELAGELRGLLDPHEVFVEPIEYRPKTMPVGTGTFRLVPGPVTPDEMPSGKVLHLALVDSAASFGHHLEGDVVTVPTNASMLVPDSTDPLETILPALAGAVLLAEDFGVGTIELPQGAEKGRRVREVASVLAASGLSLSLAA